MQRYTLLLTKRLKMYFFLRFFIKNLRFFFVVSEKSATFAPANERFAPAKDFSLGYGVMVTLQILVLPFLVRIRVPQPLKREVSTHGSLFLFCINRQRKPRESITKHKSISQAMWLERYSCTCSLTFSGSRRFLMFLLSAGLITWRRSARRWP